MSRTSAFVLSALLVAWVIFAAPIQRTIKDHDVRAATTFEATNASVRGKNVSVTYSPRTIEPPDPRNWSPPNGETWSQIRLDIRTLMVELDQHGTRRFKHSASLPVFIIFPALLALVLVARAIAGAKLPGGSRFE
jgi:hypothetical protein